MIGMGLGKKFLLWGRVKETPIKFVLNLDRKKI
jgi:hypothetical protein